VTPLNGYINLFLIGLAVLTVLIYIILALVLR